MNAVLVMRNWFLGMQEDTSYLESDLEQCIIDNLQKFLMELGKGYAFVARQQHIHTEKEDYYIDLVFYNYILKCFVLIDLKTKKITHQDVGQMDMYIRMYDELKKSEDDNPTLGIVLCSDTDEDIALKQIQAIYREEKKLTDQSAEERLQHRRLIIRPMVDAYFAWVKENIHKVPAKGKTYQGFSYSINQEKYLRVFLEDGKVPIDNNAAAESSAILYSIAETAKANNLKPYNYFEYLLSEIPNHMDDKDLNFLENLLPWSEKLPDCCRK